MWEVDNVPPDTTITMGPDKAAAPSDVTFTFTSEANATFTCQMDTQPAAACTSPKNYTALPNGTHKFTVFATDTAGNKDPTPAEYEFVVTVQVPDTTVTCPDTLIKGTSATASFAATGGAAVPTPSSARSTR
jgi:large repetitive protein